MNTQRSKQRRKPKVAGKKSTGASRSMKRPKSRETAVSSEAVISTAAPSEAVDLGVLINTLLPLENIAEVEAVLKDAGIDGDWNSWIAAARESLTLLDAPDREITAGNLVALTLAKDTADPAVLDRISGSPLTAEMESAILEIAVKRGTQPKDRLVALARMLNRNPGSGSRTLSREKATRLLKELLDHDSGIYDAALDLFNILQSRGREAESREVLASCISRMYEHTDAAGRVTSKNLSRIYELQKLLGDEVAQHQTLAMICREYPMAPGTITKIVAAIDKTGPSEALSFLTDLRAREALNFEGFIQLAYLLNMERRQEEACEALCSALDLADLSSPQLVQLFEAIVDSAGADRALEYLLDLERGYQSDRVLRRLTARLLMDRGRYAEATAINTADNLSGSGHEEFPTHLAELAQVATKSIKPRVTLFGYADMVAGLGDFAMQVIWLASVKKHFSQAHLTVLTPILRDGNQRVIDFCSEIDVHIAVDPIAIEATLAEEREKAQYTFLHRQITHLNLQDLDHVGHFVTPPELRPDLDQRLIDLGVDPTRWIAGIHTRHNSSYRSFSDTNYLRDVRGATYSKLADYIIDVLGGQVVWMGHPTMSVPTRRNGVVDLSKESMDLQYRATAASRYFIGCDSGPAMVAAGFKVPTLKSNSIYDSGVWNAHDVMLPKNILTADGKVLSFSKLWEKNHVHWLKSVWQAENFVILDNTIEQLCFCVDLLHGRTSDIQGWRPHRAPYQSSRPPDAFPLLPPRVSPGRQLIDLAHLLRRPVISIPE